MKGRSFATIKEIKIASFEELKAITENVHRKYIHNEKSASISALYLRGITLNGIKQILMNKYILFEENRKSPLFNDFYT